MFWLNIKSYPLWQAVRVFLSGSANDGGERSEFYQILIHSFEIQYHRIPASQWEHSTGTF